MIFLRYESFSAYLRLYPVTSLILAVNLVLFVITGFWGGWSSPGFEVMFRLGALTDAVPGGTDFWRWVSSMFLHFGFGHFFFNSFSIFIFSPPLERLLGHVKFFLLYIGSGLVGNLFTVMFMSKYISAGASGAAYGLLGAYLFMLVHMRHVLDYSSRKTVQTFLVLGLIYSILFPRINLLAHLGGLIGGYVLFFLLSRRKR